MYKILVPRPVCQRGLLSVEKYNHFLLLHCALYIFCSKRANELSCLGKGQELLRKFVTDTNLLSGGDFLVYNMHSLLHLPDDVKNCGKLDNYSAFPFENYLQTIKKMLRAKS